MANFLFGTAALWSQHINRQRSINWMPVLDQTEDKNIIALRGSPGLEKLAEVGDGPCKGLRVVGNYLYMVSGSELYKIDTLWGATLIGSVSFANDIVSMVDDGTYLMMVGGNGYTYHLGNGTLAQITDADFPGGDRVAYTETYFLVNSGQQINACETNDPTSWNGLDFGTTQKDGGDCIAIESLNGKPWAFTEKHIEQWYRYATADFPFTRNETVKIEAGLAAKHSLVKGDNTLIWLTKTAIGTPYVVRLTGGGVEKLSSEAMEYDISLGRFDDAQAFIYSDEGHIYYEITFPEQNKTWVLDLATGLPHERESYGIGRHRAKCHAYFNNIHIVGDYTNNHIYEMDTDIYNENGQPLVSTRIGPHHVKQSGDRIYFDEVFFDFETGQGKATGNDSDPFALLSFSDNNGIFGTERHIDLGGIGQRNVQANETRLGSSRDRVFRLRVSNDIPRNLARAELRMT